MVGSHLPKGIFAMRSEFTFIKFSAVFCAEVDLKAYVIFFIFKCQILPKIWKSAFFACFAFKNLHFAQILENFARTCVLVSMRLRSSGWGLFIRSWSSSPYLYAEKKCNWNPTFSFPPCFAFQMITEIFHWKTNPLEELSLETSVTSLYTLFSCPYLEFRNGPYIFSF